MQFEMSSHAHGMRKKVFDDVMLIMRDPTDNYLGQYFLTRPVYAGYIGVSSCLNSVVISQNVPVFSSNFSGLPSFIAE